MEKVYSLRSTNISEHFHSFIEYFQIPSLYECRTSATIAFQDSVSAVKSITQFLKLTTRPIFILLGLLSHALFAILKVLAQCTVHHSYVAVREGCTSFVQFQKGLSRFAVLMEIGFVCLLILLYTIRRYIQKKKYVERSLRWYRRKRNLVLMKYDNMVDKVASTSMILALLLPHFLYALTATSLKYFCPSLIRYLATKTILTSCIAVYWPVIKTILVIHQWTGMVLSEKKQKNDSAEQSDENSPTKGGNGMLKDWVFLPLFGKKNNSSDSEGVAKKYLQNVAASSSTENNNSSSTSNNTKKNKNLPEKSIPDEGGVEQMEEMIIKLLKYWFVYATLSATYLTFTRLPFLGRIFPAISTATGYSKSNSTSYTPLKESRIPFFGKLYFSQAFLNEFILFFFCWLNLLPTSITNGSSQYEGSGVDVKQKAKMIDKKARSSPRRRRQQLEPFTNQPLDLIYQRLSLLVVSLTGNKRILNEKTKKKKKNDDYDDDDEKEVSIASKFISFCASLLNAMVWANLITKKTKKQTLAILTECVALVPSAITLFMPSYFTGYSLIYVRLGVPACNSIQSLHEYLSLSSNNGGGVGSNVNLKQDLTTVIRYLRYWVIHFVLVFILSSFSPILDWIPMVTHMQWVLWAYVQLKSSTLKLYDTFEYELMAFGLLSQHHNSIHNGMPGGRAKVLDINDTVVVKVVSSILKRLPSSTSVGDQNSPQSTTTTTQQQKQKQVKNESDLSTIVEDNAPIQNITDNLEESKKKNEAIAPKNNDE